MLLFALMTAACGDEDPTEPQLSAPSGVTVTANGPRSVVVTFATVSGATSYVVERAEGAAGSSLTYSQAGTTTSGSFTDTGVQPQRTYRYRVAAVSGTRQSGFSTASEVTTPAEGPKTAIISGDIAANRTLYADTVYTLRGFVKVTQGVTLTIQPGTRIEGDYNTLGSSLFVLRGGRIMACATAQAPIVFTSSRPAGQRMPGDWGGLILIGNARINRGDPTNLEGTGTGPTNPTVNYGGGTNDADSSGELCYVRVEFAGYATATDAELNAFTFAAVGSGTKAEYLQAVAGLDDHFEWFGGAVDHKYLVSYEAGDDHFDAAEGYRGRVQYLIGYQSKVLVPRTGAGNVSSDPQGFEVDGCNGANCINGQSSEPYNTPMFANFTLIGTGPGLVDATSGGYGIVLRRGTGGIYVNGVVARWPKGALSLRDASTATRMSGGDLMVQNVLSVENAALLNLSSFTGATYDTTASNFRSSTGSAASVFNLLPTDPVNANQFDWSLAPASPARAGGLASFSGGIAAKAGSFIVGTAFRGAADPSGVKWWEGWTVYFDN